MYGIVAPSMAEDQVALERCHQAGLEPEIPPLRATPTSSAQCPSQQEMIVILHCVGGTTDIAGVNRCMGKWSADRVWNCLLSNPAYKGIGLGDLTPPSSQAAPNRLPTSACDDGHWVNEVLNDGAVVPLEDGTMWLVEPADRVDTALWLPTTSIVVCQGTLVNTDDGEKAQVREIRCHPGLKPVEASACERGGLVAAAPLSGRGCST
jgi:hypothetical protein